MCPCQCNDGGGGSDGSSTCSCWSWIVVGGLRPPETAASLGAKLCCNWLVCPCLVLKPLLLLLPQIMVCLDRDTRPWHVAQVLHQHCLNTNSIVWKQLPQNNTAEPRAYTRCGACTAVEGNRYPQSPWHTWCGSSCPAVLVCNQAYHHVKASTAMAAVHRCWCHKQLFGLLIYLSICSLHQGVQLAFLHGAVEPAAAALPAAT